MTKYVSSIFAFLAALTGIAGNTRNLAQPGIEGVTPLGWIALAVAVLSFIVIIVQTFRDQEKINWQEIQKTKVRCVANRQVIEAIMHFLSPFRVFLLEIYQKRRDIEIDLDRLDTDPKYILDTMSTPSIRADLKNIDLRARPNVHPPTCWWEYFAKSASETSELLNQVAAKYSGYLDSDVLVSIEDIRSDEIVSFRFPHLGQLDVDNKQIDSLPIFLAFGISEELESLDVLLCKLRKVLDHVDSNEHTA